MKLKNLIQWIFCKDLLDRVKELEENVSNITRERDDLSDKLEAAELAYQMLLAEYKNHRKNPGHVSQGKVPHCESCKCCERTEETVGKVVFTCKRKNGKQISAKERRTSPKWCPLRVVASGDGDQEQMNHDQIEVETL